MPSDVNGAWGVAQQAKISCKDEDFEQSVISLSKLSLYEYDRTREAEAKRLCIRASTLDRAVKQQRPKDDAGSLQGRTLEIDDVEPWPNTVYGADLLDLLVVTFRRYLALRDNVAEALSLWVLHTHAFPACYITPRLSIMSPQKGCGKTTLLDVLAALAARPLMASNVTAAAIFRSVEKVRPTLLIDEADSFLRDSDELRGILNAGHRRGGAVIRTVGQDNEPRSFAVWSPAAIAGIGKMPETIIDRSICINMRRKKPNEHVERFRADRASQLTVLQRKAARWANDSLQNLKSADPKSPDELSNRMADNWTALLAIADQAGGHWPITARSVALDLSAVDSSTGDNARVQALLDIRQLFESQKSGKLFSENIVAAFGDMEDRPWPEWRNGKPITKRQFANLLKDFGIRPRSIRLGGTVSKGYWKEDFQDAFARYLPVQNDTPLHPSNTDGNSRPQNVTHQFDVTDQSCLKSAEILDCNGVTDCEASPQERALREGE